MNDLFIVLVGNYAEALFSTESASEAVSSLAIVAPELRVVIRVFQVQANASICALQVVDGRWYVTGRYVSAKEAA